MSVVPAVGETAQVTGMLPEAPDAIGELIVPSEKAVPVTAQPEMVSGAVPGLVTATDAVADVP